MAIIDDLNTSISDMARNELFSLIRKLRESRRTHKKKQPFSKQKASKIDKVIKKMTLEQRQSLIEQLEGKK